MALLGVPDASHLTLGAEFESVKDPRSCMSETLILVESPAANWTKVKISVQRVPRTTPGFQACVDGADWLAPGGQANANRAQSVGLSWRH